MRDNDENRIEKGHQVLQTKEVYVLMNDDHSISRNARSSWYLRNLNAILPCRQKEQLSKIDDFEIISVIPTDDLATRERSTNCYFCLAPSTIISFLAHRYRFVFVLDTSPSLASMDATSCGVLYDRVFLSLRNTLKSLVKPFCTPGSTLQLRPQLYVSIIVHTTVISCRMKQVLLHGCHVTQENVDEILSQVRKDLIQLETSIASSITHIIVDRCEDESDLQRTSESSQIDFSIRTELMEFQSEERIILPADVSFVSMLKYGLLALQLLPENCTSGIIVITDGVIGFPDSAAFEMLMQQMRHDMVACSFIQVGSGYEVSRCYGHVPYPELMQFMATATFGTYFSVMPRLTETGDPAMNSVHRGLLTRSFQRQLDSHTLRNLFSSSLENEFFHDAVPRELSPELNCGHLWTMPFMQKRYSDNNLHAPLTAVVACRLRDGYSIRNVTIGKNPKGESQIEIRMVLPWRDRVTILYIAKSSWPLSSANRCSTHVEVVTEATQDFFQESAAFLSQPKSPSLRRMTKYWDSLKLMSQADQKMVHFQSFHANPAYYTIPGPLCDGTPLFYYPGQTSAEPQVSRQLNQRDTNIAEFVSFWRQALMMDVMMWHKWMHVHHIGLLLEHDIPVGKHLHTPNSSGRYTSILCRQALEIVVDYLRRSSSFVLMEKHSYVRLLFGTSDEVPTSFHLIRVDSKSPYLILRIAFLGGMPGKQRTHILNEIKAGISSLCFPPRGMQRQNGSKRSTGKMDPDGRQPVLERHWQEMPCCIATRKPLEKILIKYEKVPNDFSAMELIPSNEKSAQIASTSASRVALHAQTTLSNYLSHHRWIWSLQHGSVPLFTVHTVGKILSTLTKIRLQEGFHFAISSSGILNMAVEVDMQPPAEDNTKEMCTCVIQYIIFPQHNPLKNSSAHDALLRTSVMSNCSEETLDDLDGLEPEGSGLEIITECWVEPQHGVAVTDSPQQRHLSGLDYKQLLESVFPVDLDCISVLVTFEYLCLICQNIEVSPPPMAGGSSLTVTEMSNKGGQSTSQSLHLDHSIDHVSFPFDLFALLAKSQQVELLFSVYRHKEVADELKADIWMDVSLSNSRLFSLFLEQLQTLHDRELPLSEDDCHQFLKSVISRQRHLHSLPFKMPTFVEETKEPVSSNRLINESQNNCEVLDGSKPAVVAKWRCFIRSEENSHLIFTFVPAGFRDLCLLKGVEESKAVFQRQEEEELQEAGSGYKMTDDCCSFDSLAGRRERTVENEENGTTCITDKVEEMQMSALPIYVYNCPLNVVTEQLVNRWTCTCPADIFEDLTFEDDVPNFGSLQSRSPELFDRTLSPRLLDRISFPGLDPKRTGDSEATGSRDRWRQSGDDIYRDQELLGLHRTLISNLFLRCFVTGVYESLRVGRWVDSRDVDAAINRVCEESGLFEINISKFLHCSCQTMKSLVESWSQNSVEKLSEDPAKSERKSGQMNPVIGLFDTHSCEPSHGLHEFLRSKFSRILNPHFKPIPTCSEFFYYSASGGHHHAGESLTLDDDTGNCATTAAMTELEGEALRADYVNPFFSEGDLDTDVKGIQRTSARVSSNISSSDSVGDELGKSDRTRKSAGSSPPLFVHLMCSMHLPSGLQSTPVQSLPMCISELGDCVSDLALADCDINDLKVTLDFICLTLPPADEIKDGSTRPSYNRTVSNLSQTSIVTDEETERSPEIKTASTPIDLHGVKNLPKCQQQCVKACKDEILWLIEDEVISSMRLVVPVMERTLWNVVSHIKTSSSRPMCLYTDIPLQFVFGPEPSMKHFVEQFEKLRVQKYRLSKEGALYYLCKDHICNNVIEGASALSSALKSLGFSSALAAEQTNSSLSSKVETEVNNDLVDMPVANSGALELSENPVKEDNVEEDDPKESEATDGLTSSKDIQILVSRPSPIREVPVTKLQMLGQVEATTGDKEDENARPGVSDVLLNQRQSAESVPVVPQHKVPDLETTMSKTTAQVFSTNEDNGLEDPGPVKPCDPLEKSPCSVRGRVSLPEESQTAVCESAADVSGTIQSASSHPPDSEITQSEAKVRRVRPISGPANYDVVRKNQSAVDSFDGTRHPFHSFSQQNINRESPSSMKPLMEYSSVHCIKRAQSSLSFEKLRPERQKLRYLNQGACSSECNTPQADGRVSLRSRHASGLETPISAVETSSLASTGEAGYEGDSSDPDEDGAMMSYNESISTVQRRLPIPDFWQILRLNSDKVEVYFHARESFDSKSTRRYRELFRMVIDNIKQLCHSINQKLLLMDMYTKNYCNNLLVPEADEDIKWSRDASSQEKSQRRRLKKDLGSDSDSEESRDSHYLAANMQFGPGHFACECVFQTDFILHPRLKMAPQRGKESSGVQVLMSVLDKFGVVNRKNMFVLKDSVEDNVFYMRLSESSQEIKTLPLQQPSIDSDDCKMPASQDASFYTSAPNRRQDGDDSRSSSTTGMSDRDGDAQINLSQSFRSSSSLSRHRTEDRVTLLVFGICPVGLDISQNLIQVLQKKLDEAILEVVTLTLSRNAMCKLLPEDIQFIQKPYSAPVMKLQFVIPSSAILHQFPLAFYLRQNLLQFLFTPKYADGGKPENTFQDYENSPSTPVPENDVFLYIRPQQSGGKGIACIHLSFVDSKGSSIQLLGSPKLSPQAYKEPLDKSTFDGIVNTYQYRSSISPTKCPGPMSLIQFRIWECGTLDMPQLTDLLLQATKHAICDIIIEYRLLTAPICEVPQHYGKGIDSPMHSAPASPGLCAVSSESCHSQDSSIRRVGIDIGHAFIKTPKETSSSFQTLFDMLSKPNATEALPHREVKNIAFAVSESLDETKQAATERGSQELLKKIHRYENGEKGNLTQAFVTCIPDWLEHCVKLGVPAVNKYQYQLNSRFPIDYFLKESAVIVTNICQDTTTAIFRSKESFILSDGSLDVAFVPYQPMRTPAKDGGRAYVTLDFVRSTVGGFPGRAYSYMMVGRNIAEWRTIIESLQDDGVRCTSHMQPAKVYRKCQKFPPLECDAEGKSSYPSSFLPSASSSSLDQMERVTIPRQRLLLMILADKQVTLYLYNWASDLASSLERQLMRQVQWHNARSHLLSCLVTQKMGLFQHALFSDVPAESFSQESNPFLLTIGDVDYLVKSTTVPPSHLQKIRNRSGSVASSRIAHPTPLVPLGPQFDDLYRDFQPPIPMHKTAYGGLRDPLHRLGAQALELSSLEKKENEKRKRLEDLYLSWQQRSSSPPLVSDDVLNLLKRSSRLIHYVSTPLLFNPLWFRQSFVTRETTARMESMSEAKTTVSQRSRHSSGASVKSKRSDSMESTKKFMSCTSLEALNWQPGNCQWYSNLCQSFLMQYTQYLQSMSFIPINHQGQPPSSASSSEHDQSSFSSGNVDYTYLQKSLPGGVMLIELEFRDVYFCVAVYAFECSCIPVGKSISPQLTVMFTDECDKFKDLTHLHSFSHDFHVRLVQSFVSGDHKIVPSCHLTRLLQEIIAYFPNEPSFSWNYLLEATMSIACGASSGQQLFDYMLRYEGLSLTDSIAMTPIVPGDDFHHMKECRSALICRLPSDLPLISASESSSDTPMSNSLSISASADFDIGLVISLNGSSLTDSDASCLNLRYWIIVTNRQQMFPKPSLEKKLVLFNAMQMKFTVSTFGRYLGSKISASLGTEPLHQESIDYRGYSNIHQMAVQTLIVEVAGVVKVKITEMVKKMQSLCRRDFLWKYLQAAEPVEEESRRRRKTGAEEEFREPHQSKMTFSDFKDLLSLVTEVDVTTFDPDLGLLFGLPMSAYSSLVKALTNKYLETSRYLSSHSSGGSTQYVVIFNPKCSDVFVMLTLNEKNQSANMYAVYRDSVLSTREVPGLQKHLENVVNTCCYHLWTHLIS